MKVGARSLVIVTNNTAQIVQHNSHLIYSLLSKNHELVREVKILQESVGCLQKTLDNLNVDGNSSVVEQVNNAPAIVTSWLVVKDRIEARTTPKERFVTWHLLQGKVSYRIYKKNNELVTKTMINCYNNARSSSNNILYFSGMYMPSHPVTSTQDLIEWEEIVRSIAGEAIVKANRTCQF